MQRYCGQPLNYYEILFHQGTVHHRLTSTVLESFFRKFYSDVALTKQLGEYANDPKRSVFIYINQRNRQEAIFFVKQPLPNALLDESVSGEFQLRPK